MHSTQMENNRESKLIRSFIAVDVPDNIKSNIVTKHIDIKFVPKDQMHITLFFLGAISQDKVASVERLLAKFNYKSFKISLRGVSTFNERNPRVLFVKIANGADELNEIYNKLRPEIAEEGIKMESRQFTPHLTIARVKGFDRNSAIGKDLLDFMAKNKNYEFGSFDANFLVMKASVLKNTGAEHHDIYIRQLG